MPEVQTTTIIDYTYDGLYRLTAADYSSGERFHYTYDAVGNRLLQDTHEQTNTYVYDAANRLFSVDGVAYSWDDKGNLLSDGERTLTYDHANRLAQVVMGSDTYEFAYNGLGDRLRQTINTVPQNYTLDIVAGLTQVLSDGTEAYLYGVGRIGQEGAADWQYHLGDALASVRQVSGGLDATGYAQAFEPYGSRLRASGELATKFGFAGQLVDDSRLMHLRARYYSPYLKQWTQPDPILADPYSPADWNRYAYVRNNPVNLVDPSGEYGRDVHLVLTAEWASEVNRACRVAACSLLPSLISRGDQRMDDHALHKGNPDPWDLDQWDPTLLPVPLFGGEYHFVTRTEAHADANAAMELAHPFLFGVALHEIQDSYSHWEEGYRMPFGHGLHTTTAQSRDTLEGKGARYGASLLRQFYMEHPENELRTQLSRVYPTGDIARTSREALVDLYLRTYTSKGSAERDRFGYNTDLYFSFTPRDTHMRDETRRWLVAFATSLDSCESDRILTQRVPSVPEIRAFLDAQ